MNDPMNADPREANLPKWATSTLAHLRRQIEHIRAEYAKATDHEPSRVTIGDPFLSRESGLPVRYLDDDVRIRFQLSDNERDYIDVSVRNGRVTIMASGQLQIAPQVTNVVYVGLAGR